MKKAFSILMTLAPLMIFCGVFHDVHAVEVPADLKEIQAAIHERVTYKKYFAHDYRYVPRGQTSDGNCAVFAYTAFIDLLMAGKSPEIITCRSTRQNNPHVYTRLDGWAFDSRYATPIPVDKVRCF